MSKCSAWEVWRMRNQIADILVVVNLNPMEGLPVLGSQIDWKVSIYFREEDLAERIGELDETEMAFITKEYLRIRESNRLICTSFPGDKW